MAVPVLLGMANATAVMFLFGLLWMALGLARGRALPILAKLAIFLVALILATWVGSVTLHYIRMAHSSPHSSTTEIADARRRGRSFERIGLLEATAIFLAVFALRIARQPEAILPTIAIIVGLHFFPLAALFGAPVYYATGCLGCAIGIAGFFVEGTQLRNSVVGIGFGAMLWITSIVVLLQVSRAAL